MLVGVRGVVDLASALEAAFMYIAVSTVAEEASLRLACCLTGLLLTEKT